MLRFSLIVPNFNSGLVLHRCLESIRSQHYEALEVIVVDSLSADNSRSVIAKHEHWLSQVIREKDGGQADGLNKGFRRATGEIFGWLCADDELAPVALEHVSAIFKQYPDTEVVLGACERRFPDCSSAITPARS